MKTPKSPANEEERIEHLRELEILDTLPEKEYDDIVALAASIFDVPISLVSLVDENRQWFKARHGLDATETSRDVSFCGHVVEHSRELVVADALEDPRFADNPLVTGAPNVRFYAGAPLLTPGGLTLGSLCVIDHKPRAPTDEQRKHLNALARLVTSQLALRSELRLKQEMQEKLIAAREQALQADRLKSQFLATISHELRTPLNAVIGFSNLLSKNKTGGLSSRELQYTERIRDNGAHLLSLINEVLDISKIESGQMTYRKEPCDLTSIADGVLRLQEPLAEAKKLRLTLEAPERTKAVLADPGRLRQVLLNLVSNAIKFTESGEVTLAVLGAPDSRRVACIEVRDTGPGIPESDLDSVFSAFVQLDGAASRSHEGTGLGLAISRSLCEGMGLSLRVRSAPGSGSTFTIDIPEHLTVEHTEEPPKQEKLVESFAKRRVLVIDDNDDSRELITAQLRDLGCTVRTASDGSESLRIARGWKPDLITLDLMIPKKNGWQVLSSLKTDPDLKSIPVVIISMIADESRGTVAGAVDVIQKPLQRDSLKSVLGRLVNQSQKALVIDDNQDSRRLLSSYLEDAGFLVAEAANGEEGLRALDRFEPDVVFLDLMMPVMSGPEFLDRLRKLERWHDLAVVVVSAKNLDEDERRAILERANRIIGKGHSLESDLRSALASVARPNL